MSVDFEAAREAAGNALSEAASDGQDFNTWECTKIVLDAFLAKLSETHLVIPKNGFVEAFKEALDKSPESLRAEIKDRLEDGLCSVCWSNKPCYCASGYDK